MSWLLRTKVYPLNCGEEERRSFSEGFLLFTLIRCYNYNQKYFSVKFSSTFLWSFFILTFLVQITINILLVFLTVKLTIYVDLFFTVEKRYKHHIDGFYYVLNVLMEWSIVRIICAIYCFTWAPLLAQISPLVWFIIDIIMVIWASIFLFYQKKKKRKINDSVYVTIWLWLIFAFFSFIKAKDSLDIPQFTNGFMYYFPQVLMAIWMFPMVFFLLIPVYFFLAILRSKRLDDFNARFEKPIPRKFWAKERGEIIMDVYTKCLVIWRCIATIWLILWWIFTPTD